MRPALRPSVRAVTSVLAALALLTGLTRASADPPAPAPATELDPRRLTAAEARRLGRERLAAGRWEEALLAYEDAAKHMVRRTWYASWHPHRGLLPREDCWRALAADWQELLQAAVADRDEIREAALLDFRLAANAFFSCAEEDATARPMAELAARLAALRRLPARPDPAESAEALATRLSERVGSALDPATAAVEAVCATIRWAYWKRQFLLRVGYDRLVSEERARPALPVPEAAFAWGQSRFRELHALDPNSAESAYARLLVVLHFRRRSREDLAEAALRTWQNEFPDDDFLDEALFLRADGHRLLGFEDPAGRRVAPGCTAEQRAALFAEVESRYPGRATATLVRLARGAAAPDTPAGRSARREEYRAAFLLDHGSVTRRSMYPVDTGYRVAAWFMAPVYRREGDWERRLAALQVAEQPDETRCGNCASGRWLRQQGGIRECLEKLGRWGEELAHLKRLAARDADTDEKGDWLVVTRFLQICREQGRIEEARNWLAEARAARDLELEAALWCPLARENLPGNEEYGAVYDRYERAANAAGPAERWCFTFWSNDRALGLAKEVDRDTRAHLLLRMATAGERGRQEVKARLLRNPDEAAWTAAIHCADAEIIERMITLVTEEPKANPFIRDQLLGALRNDVLFGHGPGPGRAALTAMLARLRARGRCIWPDLAPAVNTWPEEAVRQSLDDIGAGLVKDLEHFLDCLPERKEPLPAGDAATK